MPVDIKSILAAAEPKPIIDPQVMSLARLAQANRTFKQAKDLREKQEYNSLAIAQGQEMADSVNFMDSIADIDIAIGDLSDIAQANKDNNLVQASYAKIRGGLENTRELSIGRSEAVEALSTLRGDMYKMFENLSKGALYNEDNVLDLINNTRNFVNTKAHFLDKNLRTDIEAEIDKLSKTVNVYNMFEFYDTNLKTPGIDFETKPESAKYLSGMQQGILQQSKNYADSGLIDLAANTIAALPAAGLAESKIYASAGHRKETALQISEHGSELTDIIQEQKTSKGIIGEGVEAKLEKVLPPKLKEDLGGMLILLPSSPQSVAGPGGARTVQGAINRSQDMLGIILGHAVGNIFSMERLDDIKLTKEEASSLDLPAGSDLGDVYDSYGMVVSDEEKAPYMKMLAYYLAKPKHATKMTRGFKGGDVFLDRLRSEGGTPEEHNAVKLMSGVARTINKLYDLQIKHYGQFPISQAYDSLFQSQVGHGGQQSTNVEWPGQ